MGGLFSKPKKPKPVVVPKPAPMPVPDEEGLRKVKKKKVAQAARRSGRASTVLSEDQGLGG